MPDFAGPLSRLGSSVGNLFGGGLGGVLGQISGVMDMPRQMLWNGLTGLVGDPTSSGHELLSRAGMDPDSIWTHALGTGLEMASDPMTLLFGGLGRGLGKLAGARGGQALEAAAIARGPGYGGGTAKFVAGGMPQNRSGQMLLEALHNSPYAERIAREIPEGSQLVNNGAQALIYKTPVGDTVRIAPRTPGEIDRLARPNIPEMLQTNRGGMIGPEVRVERAPWTDTTPYGPTTHETPVMRRGGQSTRVESPQRRVGDILSDRRAVADAAEQAGYWPADVHSGNLGIHEGRVKAIDPGAILQREGGPQLAPLPDWNAQQPGRIANWFLDRLGSDRMLQEELARGAGSF